MVYAGLGQAELMLGRYDAADAHARRVFELLSIPAADPLAWSMARRVIGIAVDHRGDPTRGVELCRDAVAAAPSALTRAIAVLYLAVALLDAGRYQDAVDEMLAAAADAHLTGLDKSFGGYVDALTAEGLMRLGRWSEAADVLESSEGAPTPSGRRDPTGPQRRHARRPPRRPRTGDGAARRGGGATGRSVPSFVPRRGHRRCPRVVRRVGGHRIHRPACTDGGPGAAALWQARFVMFDVIAQVELALDARARLEPTDAESTTARLARRSRSRSR